MIHHDEVMEMLGDVLSEEQKRRAALIHSFHKIQKEKNYLPEEDLKALSEELQIPLSDIYSTASFYKQFHFKPRGKNIVCVCVGTACHVRGAQAVVNKLESAFGIKAGETTKDLSVTLETVGCIGCCGLAPAVVVNDEIVGEVNSVKVDNIVETVKQQGSKVTE